MEYASHLTCHTEAAYTALFCAITQAKAATTVGVNKVGNEALLAKFNLS